VTPELQSLLPAALAVAREAGSEILRIYGSATVQVELKDDQSPLTAADRAAHEVIVRGLRALTPGVPVWSEESAEIPYAERAGWPRFWLVDPLDGTREFIKRNGEFTVNIALVEQHSPVLGVVHVPALGRDYFGADQLGAFRADAGGAARRIQVRRPAARPPRIAGSRSHGGDSLQAFLAAVGPHELVSMGSSLKFCLVAEGAADVYPRLGPTAEWDTAAAQAVVEAAGGAVVDLAGAPLRYNRHARVLNPHFVAYGDADPDWVALLGAAGTSR
jgi:3'(2'), 5'-bisphosphate nucleotidase